VTDPTTPETAPPGAEPPGRPWPLGRAGRWVGVAAVALLCLALAPGVGRDAGRDRRFDGETVTIFGPEIEDEQRSLTMAFAAFEDETGVDVEVIGHRDFEARVGPLVAGGNPPDIAMFPQPGKVRDFVDRIVPLPEDVAAQVREDFAPEAVRLVTNDTDLLAVPVKGDLKSLVWYSPRAFAERGYTVPRTFDEFLALSERIAADGEFPFCVGLESGSATGWPLTDWIEDFVLRRAGPAVYDAWVAHEVPFDDPAVVAAAEEAVALLSRPGYVHGEFPFAAARSFTRAGDPVLGPPGDRCLMYRMSSYYRANWPEDTEFGPDGDIDAFYLPDTTPGLGIALVGGTFAAAFSDDPAVTATMAFMASTDFAAPRARTAAGGFVSANLRLAPAAYPSPLDGEFATILQGSSPLRFDASDLMPGAVGSGSFWRAAVDISTGELTVAEAFARVEAGWPAPGADP
jgi:alpha-glucoside transport system substrate-binding protein